MTPIQIRNLSKQRFASLLSLASILITTQASQAQAKHEWMPVPFVLSHQNNQKGNYAYPKTNEKSKAYQIATPSSQWAVSFTTKEGTHRGHPYVDTVVHFCLVKGASPSSQIGVEWSFLEFGRETYWVQPASVYNGNRFEITTMKYPNAPIPEKYFVPDPPVVVTDIVHLSNDPTKHSILEQKSGDMATPSVGWLHRSLDQQGWLLFEERNECGEIGVTIEEPMDKDTAFLRLLSPCVREIRPQQSKLIPAHDTPKDFKEGDTVTLRYRFYDRSTHQSVSMNALYKQFFDIRDSFLPKGDLATFVPFSEVYRVMRKHFNEFLWREDFSHYTHNIKVNAVAVYALGWVGSGPLTAGKVFDSDPLTRERVMRHINMSMEKTPTKSGFLKGFGSNGRYIGDRYYKDYSRSWSLIRRNADGFFFYLRQIEWLKQEGEPIPNHWNVAMKNLANAFVKLWEDNGQFGFIVDVDKNEMKIGGTTSGILAIGGLALASNYFENPKYLQIAEEAAAYYEKFYHETGFFNGGPGDAAMSIDSESTYAALDAYINLFEVTQKPRWLHMAEAVAFNYSTWVMSYDYDFPEDTTFGKLGLRTTGSVWANIQNRHAAPVLCTASGDALIRLYLATGEPRYIELLQDTARNAMQFVHLPSRPLPPLPGLPPKQRDFWQFGSIGEKVQTTDWPTDSRTIGEVAPSSAFPEMAISAITMELPGIYIDPKKALCVAIDHMNAEVIEKTKECLKVSIKNPTKIDAVVQVLSRSSEAHTPLINLRSAFSSLSLSAGETVILRVSRNNDPDFEVVRF